MTEWERALDAVDLLCVTAEGGTLGFAAADVAAIRDAGAAADVPSAPLASILGPGASGAVTRRIRVAAAEAPPFDLVTNGVIHVRTVTRSAFHPLPAWLSLFCAPLGAESILLEDDALVLVVDARRLGVWLLGAEGSPAGGAPPPAPEAA